MIEFVPKFFALALIGVACIAGFVGLMLTFSVVWNFWCDVDTAIARWFDKGIVSDFVTQKLDEIFGNRRE